MQGRIAFVPGTVASVAWTVLGVAMMPVCAGVLVAAKVLRVVR